MTIQNVYSATQANSLAKIYRPINNQKTDNVNKTDNAKITQNKNQINKTDNTLQHNKNISSAYKAVGKGNFLNIFA